MPGPHRLGDLQLAIMQVIWNTTEATVTEVHAELFPSRGLALTTIATMLRKMEDRNLVAHRTDGRQYVYRALVEESEVRQSMMTDLADRLFHGDIAAMVGQLLDEREIDTNEIDQLKQLIHEKEQHTRSGS